MIEKINLIIKNIYSSPTNLFIFNIAFQGLKIIFISFIIFAITSKLRNFFRKYGDKFNDARDTFFNLIGDIIFFCGLLAIILVIFKFFGIDLKGIIAGMGLTGFVLGMALKDILSNLVSGMIILFTKPFNIGDSVIIGGKQGIVYEINLRHILLTNESDLILVPTASAFSSTIVINNKKNE
ncbi:MAG: mechanosensitive ion channel family protein [Candidatus Muirbacterium halophilum]|nr:mechanosensitive ion channel family protein [Candidatus Muirbacterium halophilum]MCK9474564.1 mechanosensitive ion channel family protein [Candidatus Muirbacterium halophilum]